MLYTFLKFLAWGVLLAFIGGCVGWALRALQCRGELARARATTVDEDEVERMRHRLANLEQVVAERDRLRMQVADMRHADSPGVVGVVGLAGDDADVAVPTDTDVVFGASDADTDTDQLVADQPVADDHLAADADTAADDPDVDGSPSIAPGAGAGAGTDADEGADVGSTTDVAFAATGDTADDTAGEPAVELDMSAAADAIGKKIKLDDLTAVEGIGPKIAELCNGIGVTTWQQLADAEVSALQSMLDDAGSRFQVHKPASWPRQAGLLAAGQWAEFVALTDELDGGA